METMTETTTETAQGLPEYVLEREFAAPQETVWRAWTDPELLVRWFGPSPTCETRLLEFSLAPGGVCHYEMRFGEAPPHYGRFEFESVAPPERLSWLDMSSNAAGEVVRNQRMPDWPLKCLTTIALTDQGDGTLLRLTCSPADAAPHEIEAFRKAMGHMGQGWGGGFANLETLLAELTA